MIIYSVNWEEFGESSQEIFKTKKEAIEFAQSYPWDDEERAMAISRIETPRPSSELLFAVIKAQGGGYALSQKTVWKNEAQKEQDKVCIRLGIITKKEATK